MRSVAQFAMLKPRAWAYAFNLFVLNYGTYVEFLSWRCMFPLYLQSMRIIADDKGSRGSAFSTWPWSFLSV
jgi:hypothetical protein